MSEASSSESGFSNNHGEQVVIENQGEWDWSLTVRDGEVRAGKAIPYDGALVYSTKERHTSKRSNSQYNLSAIQVIDYYERHTSTSWGALVAQVNDALESQTGSGLDGWE